MFAALAGLTLIIANGLVRQRAKSGNGKPQLGRDMFRDVPFLLMSAGKYNLSLKVKSRSFPNTIVSQIPFPSLNSHTNHNI